MNAVCFIPSRVPQNPPPSPPASGDVAQKVDRVFDGTHPQSGSDNFDMQRVTQPFQRGGTPINAESGIVNEQRLQKLEETLKDATANERQDIIAEVLKRDPNAFSTWLSPSFIRQKVESGLVSPVSQENLAVSVAQAYNNNKDVALAIDKAVGKNVKNGMGADDYKRFDDVSALFSCSPFNVELCHMRESMATRLLDDKAKGRTDEAAVAAAGLSAELLTAGDPSSVPRVLGKYAGQNGDVTELTGILSNIDAYAAVRTERGVRYERDLLNDVINSAALRGKVHESLPSEEKTFNVNLVRSLGDMKNVLDGHAQRQSSVGQLFKADGANILAGMTSADNDKNIYTAKGPENLLELDARRLGRIWGGTLFSSSAPSDTKDLLRNSISQFVESQNQTLNSSDASKDDKDAAGKSLGFLMGSLDVVPYQKNFDAEQTAKAKEEMLKLMIDVILTPVLGAFAKVGSKALEEALGKAQGMTKTVLQAMKDVVGATEDKVIDKTTKAKILEKAKEEVEKEHKSDPGLINSINDLRDAVLGQVTADGYRHDITSEASRVVKPYQKPS